MRLNCTSTFFKLSSTLLFASLCLVAWLASAAASDNVTRPTSASDTDGKPTSVSEAEAPPVLSSTTDKRRLKEVVDHAEEELENEIIGRIQHARLAGINSSSLAAVEEQVRVRAAAALKDAVKRKKDAQSADEVMHAFVRAARSGVSQDERGAAWTEAQKEVSALLAPAIQAANASRTERNMLHLAEAMHLGHKFGLQEADASEHMVSAKKVYERQLEQAFQEGDVNFTMFAVRHAGKVQAKYSQELQRWAEAAENAEQTAGSDEQSLPVLLDVLNYAKEVNLPETTALQKVKGTVQHQVIRQLREKTQDGQNIEDVDDIQQLLAVARTAGSAGNSSLVSTVEMKVRQHAEDALKSALGLKKEARNVPEIRAAFAKALRAGLPSHDAQRSQFIADAENMLVTATKEANASWTAGSIVKLADAIHLWRELQPMHGTNSENATTARAVFERHMEEKFQNLDVNLTLLAVRMAGKADAHHSQELRRFAEAADNIEQAAAAQHEHGLQALENMLNYAKEVNLPRTKGIEKLEASMREQTLRDLLHAWKSQGNKSDLDVMLPLLQHAKAANASDPQIGSIEKSLRDQVDSNFNAAMKLPKLPSSVEKIKVAFRDYARVGAPETERKTAWQKLQADINGMLLDALTAAKRSWSTDSITRLADSIHLAQQFDLHQQQPNNVTEAKEVFEAEMESSYQKHDVNATLAAVRMAGKANARFSQEVRRYAEAAENVVSAAGDPDSHQLPILFDILRYAKEVNLPSFAELQHTEKLARSLAEKSLVSARAAGGHADTLRAALNDAVRAGVPEAELVAARATLARSEL